MSLLLLQVIVLLAILSLFNSNHLLALGWSCLQYDVRVIEEVKKKSPIKQHQLLSSIITTTTNNSVIQNNNNNDTAIKKFTLLAQERIVQISPDNELHPGGIFYKAMTFNGSIPAPAISVNQGDTFEITLENRVL